MNYPKAIYETGEDVKIGDYVQFRAWIELWLKKRTGRVMFVPGISPHNPTLEYNGLKWISIDEEKIKIGGLVDPKTGIVRKFKFIKRTDDDLKETPNGYEFEDNKEEVKCENKTVDTIRVSARRNSKALDTLNLNQSIEL